MIRLIVGPNGTVYGRAALLPKTNVITTTGVLTAGGLRVKLIPHVLGIVIGGEVETAARDRGRFVAPSDAFATWASEQGKLLEQADVTDKQKAEGAEIILARKSLACRRPAGETGPGRRSLFSSRLSRGGLTRPMADNLPRIAMPERRAWRLPKTARGHRTTLHSL